MHTKDVGDISEAKATAKLKELGHIVCLPFGDNAPYDLIYDDGELTRAQVKTGRLSDGRVEFRCDKRHRSNGASVPAFYEEGSIDVFIVYCPSNSKLYEVPVADASSTEMYLRIEPPKNGQTVGVNWAEDYEITE